MPQAMLESVYICSDCRSQFSRAPWVGVKFNGYLVCQITAMGFGGRWSDSGLHMTRGIEVPTVSPVVVAAPVMLN